MAMSQHSMNPRNWRRADRLGRSPTITFSNTAPMIALHLCEDFMIR